MDAADNCEDLLQVRIEYSGPRKCRSGDVAPSKYSCAYCSCVIDVWPGQFRLCQSPDCLEAAIRDRQIRIGELELDVPRVRRKVNEEETRLLEEIGRIEGSGGEPVVLAQYHAVLKSLRGSTRYFSKDHILNQILELQEQIEQIARRINRPTFSDEFRRRIWERDCKICYICRRVIVHWDGEHMQLDHVAARSKGGSDDERNLRAAHPSCNLKKGNRPLSTPKMRALLREIRKTEEETQKDRLF